MDSEHPMATPGPLKEVRDGFTPQTSDLRGSLPSPDFTLVTSIDNGLITDGRTGMTGPPTFGNC